MVMGDDWSFNLRTCGLASDDDPDSDNDLPPDQLSNDTEFLRQIDLSSRQDHAEYKPNPWSIAKVNAASRPKAPVVIKPAGLPANAKTKPKGAIVDAFKKQAEKPKPKFTRQPAPVRLPPQREEDQAEKRLDLDRNDFDSQQNASNLSATSRLPQFTHTPIAINSDVPRYHRNAMLQPAYPPDPENAHIVTKKTSVRLSTAHMASSGLTMPYNDSAESSAGAHTPYPTHQINPDRSSAPAHHLADPVYPHLERRQNALPSPLQTSPNRLPPFTRFPPTSQQKLQASNSARASIDLLFKRTANQTSARHFMSSPPALASYSPHQHQRHVHSSPVPPARQVRPTQPFPQPEFLHAPPQCQRSPPTRKRKAESPLPSPPRPPRVIPSPIQTQRPRKRKADSPPPSPSPARYLRSPASSPPGRIKPNIRKNAYDSSPSPDSSWSTLPGKKKGGASTRKQVKESGAFKLPMSLARGRPENGSRAVGGGSKPRVVTYLPPPPKKKVVLKEQDAPLETVEKPSIYCGMSCCSLPTLVLALTNCQILKEGRPAGSHRHHHQTIYQLLPQAWTLLP